ncbi:hypothetical protein BDR07DRAFT_1408346 [Suillus spraguei]|nr:hypothetical protein BDR07DRAFT_1408346 [Suillus spraguei]
MHCSNAFHGPDCSSCGWCSWWRNSSFRRAKRSRSVNHGVHTTPGLAPPWRSGFLPRYTWRAPAWADTSRANWPTLPARQPDHNVWSFPTGNLTWTPHMNGPVALFAIPWSYTADERPEIARCLAINPFQPDMPILQWDIRQNPITARLTTGAHISTDLAHVLSSQITDIPVSIIEMAIPACPMAYMWGVIRVQRSSAIKVQDVLDAIYEWLQIPLTRAEMEHIEHVNPDDAGAVWRALQERASTSPTLRGWEFQQGPRRIDCFRDVRRWVGLSYSPAGQGMQLVLSLQTIPR